MRSLFLLAPWMGQSSGTPMPAYIVGPERTAVDVVRLIPILERTVPINLRWIFRHCFSLKQVAPLASPLQRINRLESFANALPLTPWLKHNQSHLFSLSLDTSRKSLSSTSAIMGQELQPSSFMVYAQVNVLMIGVGHQYVFHIANAFSYTATSWLLVLQKQGEISMP